MNNQDKQLRIMELRDLGKFLDKDWICQSAHDCTDNRQLKGSKEVRLHHIVKSIIG